MLWTVLQDLSQDRLSRVLEHARRQFIQTFSKRPHYHGVPVTSFCSGGQRLDHGLSLIANMLSIIYLIEI